MIAYHTTLSVRKSIIGRIPGRKHREIKGWNLKSFTVEGNVIKGDGVKEEAEFLNACGDNILEADFQDSYLVTLWRKAGLEYPISSDRTIKIVIRFATRSRCEAALTVLNI
jgi:hypothetical protein